MTPRPRAGVFSRRQRFFDAFTDEHLAELLAYVDLDVNRIPERLDGRSVRRAIRDARVLIGSWSPARLTARLLDTCPELELIVYAGGSIKTFYTDEIQRRGITVCSAVEENARPVAEFVLGLILTSLKNVFSYHSRFLTEGGSAWHRDPGSFEGGYYGSRVGILGYGRISRRLITLLRPFELEVCLEDPFVTEEEARELGVRLASLEEIMASAEVCVAHASVEEIDEINILRASHLAMERAVAGLSVPPDHCLIDGNLIPGGLAIPATADSIGGYQILATLGEGGFGAWRSIRRRAVARRPLRARSRERRGACRHRLVRLREEHAPPRSRHARYSELRTCRAGR